MLNVCSPNKIVGVKPGVAALGVGSTEKYKIPTRIIISTNPNRPSALAVAYLTIASFATLSVLSQRVRTNPSLLVTFWIAVGSLIVMLLLLRYRVSHKGRVLTYEFAPKKVHYIQLMMQGCVYAYWGWYWREVYRYVPLLVSQIIFAYALDMLLSWWRRGKWVVGLGPFPIVLSTNLFLWFTDEWFFLQFLMIAAALVGKEFVTWTRDGRRVHIFNPSAFALFIFSVSLIAGHATHITRGQEIAFTFAYPPHIYMEIFLVGLVVQALFSVTPITLSAVTVLYGLNVAYSYITGSHQFVDSNLPVLVFLGAHLLVTDPATSPRTNIGRIIFGGLYGIGVFATRGLLAWFDAPVFYDKLLVVPALNLTAPVWDRILEFANRSGHRSIEYKWSPPMRNAAQIALWIVVFSAMISSGFLAETRSDGNPDSLRRACLLRKDKVCADWIASLRLRCENKLASACLLLGRVLSDGRVVPRDSLSATRHFRRACELGLSMGCVVGGP